MHVCMYTDKAWRPKPKVEREGLSKFKPYGIQHSVDNEE